MKDNNVPYNSYFDQVYHLAYIAYQKTEYEKAYDHAKDLLSLFPENPTLLLLEADIYVGLNEYKLADISYQRVIELSENKYLVDRAQVAIRQIRNIDFIEEKNISNDYDEVKSSYANEAFDNSNNSDHTILDYSQENLDVREGKYDLKKVPTSTSQTVNPLPTPQDKEEQIEKLRNDLDDLKRKISQINFQNIAASFYPHLIQDKITVKLIDFPLSRIIDIYHEAPQILEANGCQVALVSGQNESFIFELSAAGNFWVFQLKNSGFYLFPKPSYLKRTRISSEFRKIFNIKNTQNKGEFVVSKPAKLEVLKINFSWHLVKTGEIVLQESPLEFQWQQEISSIRNQYEQFNQLFNERGYAGLDFTIGSQQYEQSLLKKYGNKLSIFVNMRMPVACSIYEGEFLVPCQILMSNNPIVAPAWDRGVPLKSSIYSGLETHYGTNQEHFCTPDNHPVLPNQVYVKEVSNNANHTWAIAKSYTEASDIVKKINGRWGYLFLP